MVGVFTSVLFCAIGYAYLTAQHPHEDAYILFRYVENLAVGRGIVFNGDGPRAEGATDFLWLLLLAGPTALGLDVAVSALALNSVGAGLASALIYGVLRGGQGLSPVSRILLLVVPVSVVFSHGAAASYRGFSTMLYSALHVLLFCLAIRPHGRFVLALPVASLTIALFRPEGVIAGAAFALLGVWPARHFGKLKPYLAMMAATAFVGLGYFAWRYAYFGLLLPLPLYVKSRKGAPIDEVPSLLAEMFPSLLHNLPGLESNLQWLTLSTSPLPTLVALVGLLFVLRHIRIADVTRIIFFLTPMGLAFCGLMFAQQSQNVLSRFQAPISLVLFCALMQATRWAMNHYREPIQRSALMALLVPVFMIPLGNGLSVTSSAFRHDDRKDYMDTFAPLAGRYLGPDDVVAITEAGRLPYWTTARFEDMIGLNSPERALFPPTFGDIMELDPDVVMFHHARTLDPGKLVSGSWASDNVDDHVIVVPPARLQAAVRDELRPIYEHGISAYRDTEVLATQVVPVILTRYLVESQAYDIVIADLRRNGQYFHVYGFRRNWPHTEELLNVMKRSFQRGSYLSYLEARRVAIPPPPRSTNR